MVGGGVGQSKHTSIMVIMCMRLREDNIITLMRYVGYQILCTVCIFGNKQSLIYLCPALVPPLVI